MRASWQIVDTTIEYFYKFLEFMLFLLLAGMVVMVFGNVVLRYGFNTGINVSEEMSRYFFVWLTFIGAVVTFRENSHMGVETLVRVFGRRGRMVCMLLTNVLILGCAVALFWGTWRQSGINASMHAAVVGISMIWVFGITFFTAIGIGLIALIRIIKILTNTIKDSEIASFAGEYADLPTVPSKNEGTPLEKGESQADRGRGP